MIEKALPKDKAEKNSKKKPVKTAAGKKKAGKNGKTRYTYPKEKGGATAKPGRPISPPPGSAGDEDYMPPARQPQQLPVDPNKLCAQLGIQKETLEKVISQFSKNGQGSKGFAKFWLSQARKFSEKHGLDAGYWKRLFESVVTTNPKLQ